MKPLGDITKYYPFIDDESKSILDGIMNESSNYYQFTQQLCEVTLENDVPFDVAYVTAAQAWWCRLDKEINCINKKFGDVPQITPWGHTHASSQRDQIRYHDSVVAAIDKLMIDAPEDWILAELHLLHAHFHWPMYGDTPSQLEPVEKARELIISNPLLECYEAQSCFYDGWVKRVEGNFENSVNTYRRGLDLANAHDLSIYRYLNLGGLGDVLKNVDINEAMARFEESYIVTQDLGVPYLEFEVLHDSGLVFEVAGEYDLALSSYLESERAAGLGDKPSTNSPQIARVHVVLGNSQRALDIINRFSEAFPDVHIQAVYGFRAAALAQLNMIKEAENDLIKSHEIAIKSGVDRILGRHYYAAGVVELEKGNYLSAMDFFEKMWNLFERVGEVYGEKNLALIGLAKSEMLLENQTKDESKSITPGRWFCKLENYATDRELPGIRMQVALLKSEFYQNHGQLKDAYVVLADALKITESQGVATFRKWVRDRMNEIDQLMQKQKTI